MSEPQAAGEGTPPVAPKTRNREKAQGTKSKSKGSSSSSALKEAEKRIKALEGQLEAARQTAAPSPISLASGQQLNLLTIPPTVPELSTVIPEGDWSPERQPSVSVDPSLPTQSWPLAQGTQRPRAPSATFTPTAAGLRAPQETWQTLSPAVQEMLASAYTQGIAAGVHQYAMPTPTRVEHRNVWAVPPQSPQDSYNEEPGLMETGSEPEEDFSEDEATTATEQPTFTGLFKPHLFKLILHKAKQTLAMDSAAQPAQPSVGIQPATRLLTEPQKESDTFPASPIFVDNVKRTWEHPAAALGPSVSERKFYAFDPEMETLLQFPTVDPPVASLVSNALVPSEMAEGLKPDDRKAESLIKKSHQTSTWAFRAASAASFFNRASILWLRDILARLGPEEGRLRQDINKLLAAAEFSADATLTAAKFAARSMAANLSSRRLLWLRSWQADAKSRWRLASAPFQGMKLFGEALDSVLIEDKDKKKVLPSSSRRQDRRQTPYQRRPPFRSDAPPATTQAYRPYQAGVYQQSNYRTDRTTFPDRSRQFQARRPFKSYNSRGYRKTK